MGSYLTSATDSYVVRFFFVVFLLHRAFIINNKCAGPYATCVVCVLKEPVLGTHMCAYSQLPRPEVFNRGSATPRGYCRGVAKVLVDQTIILYSPRNFFHKLKCL